MKHYFLLILAIPILFHPRIQAQPCDCQWPTDVIILHVNDMHSKIDNMGKLAYLVDSLEHTCKHVFVVSAGDNFTGNPVVDMVSDPGSPMVDLMNRCGFDVSGIGNHEFDMGQEGLNRRFRQAEFPFVSCNTDASGAVLEQPKPYMLKRVGKGNRIAFLGITQVGANGMPDSHPSRLEGLKFTDPVTTALGYAKLKDKDVLIAVTHLGKETDVELARRMPQLDVIIGGHSHDRLDSGIVSNGVLITQAGKDLKYIGKTFIRLEKGRVVYRNEEMIPLNSLTRSDPKVQELIDRYNSNEELNRPVGMAEVAVEGYDQLGSLMTDALVHETGAEVAFQNRGGIRTSVIAQGAITLKDIFRLDPFGNKVVVMTLTEPEVRSLICAGFNIEKTLDLEVSGLTYEVIQGADGTCTDVVLKDKSGAPFETSRRFKVAMNSYIAAAYRFDHSDPGTALDLSTADALIRHLGSAGKINYSGVRRINVREPGH